MLPNLYRKTVRFSTFETVSFLKKKRVSVFPRLCDTFKDLVPQVYFGGEHIPPYLTSALPEGASIEEIVAAIREIGSGSNSCGYIESGSIHYHLDEDGHFLIDRSKEFIYLGDFNVETQSYQPPSFAVLQFLQDPCHRALFVNIESAVYIEKSPDTYALCTELDRFWEDMEVSKRVMEAVDSGTFREKALPLLLKAYEKQKHSESSEMWEFWETFRVLLMRERLKLAVKQIDA